MHPRAIIALFVGLTLIFSGATYYQQTKINALQDETQAIYHDLHGANQRITGLVASTDEAILSLDDKVKQTKDTLDESVKNVQTNVETLSERSELQVQQLSTEIETAKQESDQQIKKLEKQLSLNLRSDDFSRVVEDVIESVASVHTDKGVGSGVFVDGYIITNYHVIKGANAATIITSDQEQHGPVQIIGFDEDKDIAVLKIEGTYPPLVFADSDDASIGQRVIALGSPGGLQFSVTEGIISATNREYGGQTYIQTDVPINPGNSGGPLVDSRGEIVGISTKKIQNYEGIGFAIPSNVVKAVFEEIIATQ